tara:strand:+ start:44 stop:583 length:540 start_codon:yes stop_codon:yes gene_type:complete
LSRKVYQYQPYNDTPDQPLGILLPLNKSAGGARSIDSAYNADPSVGKGVFVSSYTTEEQSLSNLKNLILTRKGERYFLPDFGTNIQAALFENSTLDLELQLQETVTADIEKWLPYIKINELKIVRNIDNQQIAIRLSFSVTENGANQEIVIFASPDSVIVQDGGTAEVELQLAPIGGGY